MKPGFGLLRDLLGFVVARVLQRISSGPREVVTDEQLQDALHVGGPTQDALERARAAADERWPKDEPGLRGTPSRDELN